MLSSCAKRKLQQRGEGFLLPWAAFFVFLFVQAPLFAIEPVVVDERFASASLGAHLELWEDASASHTLDEVVSGRFVAKFKPSHEEAPSFGYTQSAIWLRFAVENRNAGTSDVILELANPVIDSVSFYIPGKQGFSLEQSGDHTPFSLRKMPYRTILLPFTVQPGIHMYYIRVQTESQMSLPLTLWTPRAFFRHANVELPFLWMFYGIMLVIVIYNAIIFISTRDMSYLYFVLVILGYVAFQFARNGFAGQYLWGESIWWQNVCIPFFISLASAAYTQFSRTFLKTRHYFPVLDRLLFCITSLFMLFMVLSLMLDYSLAIQTMLGLLLLTMAILIYAAFSSMRKGSREAAFYLFAWSLTILGTFLNVLRDFGVLPESFLTDSSQQIGVTCQVLLLSLGLADRIITMRKKIKETRVHLQEARVRLDQERELALVTLKSITEGVIVTDLEGRIFLMNTLAENITGLPENQAAGKDVRELFSPVSCTGEDPDIILEILESKGDLDLSGQDLLVLKEDGTLCHISCRCSPIRNLEREAVGIIITFSDVTRQHKYEEEITRTSKLDGLSTLAGGIAHDFNNILTAIIGNLSLAKIKSSDQGFVTNLLTDIETATYRAKDLTQQLLAFSREGKPLRRVSNIGDLVREAVGFHLSGSNVHVDIDIEDNLWNTFIDEGQINQVIGNLAINAKQAMPEGGTVWVTVVNEVLGQSNAQDLPAGKYVKISVRDEGCGILPEHQERIFEPFYTTKVEGSGLGLASSRSVVENHDGFIRVVSSPGQGAEFIVRLPATEERAAQAMPGDAKVMKGSGKILLVDDEDIILKSIGALIKALGYDVTCVRNGFQAVNIFREAVMMKRPFDLVITDLIIPGSMGGKDTVQRLLEIDSKAKVILTSGYSNDPVMVSYKSFGFANVLVKPCSLKTLSRVIAEALA